MTYACPYCPNCATRDVELVEHLKARRLWGGHEINRAKAVRIVERMAREARAKKRSLRAGPSAQMASTQPKTKARARAA